MRKGNDKIATLRVGDVLWLGWAATVVCQVYTRPRIVYVVGYRGRLYEFTPYRGARKLRG